jgi:hypothetical protein
VLVLLAQRPERLSSNETRRSPNRRLFGDLATEVAQNLKQALLLDSLERAVTY